MSSVYEEVDRAVREGRVPASIDVAPGMRIVVVRSKGVLKVRTTEDRRRGTVMRTATGRAMRCRNKGCHNELRKYNKGITCSLACENDLKRWCYTMLDILEGLAPASTLPMWMRSIAAPKPRRRK